MNTYSIVLEIDGEEITQRFSGYTEQVAIAQAMLYNGQNGARSVVVKDTTEIKLKQKPHDIDKEEATNIIYDTLMKNTNFTQLDLDFIDLQECEAKDGSIYFDYDTEKGVKRIFMQISVEDKDEDNEE